jgi:hypothetical protein
MQCIAEKMDYSVESGMCNSMSTPRQGDKFYTRKPGEAYRQDTSVFVPASRN